jgi:hypothetical protein
MFRNTSRFRFSLVLIRKVTSKTRGKIRMGKLGANKIVPASLLVPYLLFFAMLFYKYLYLVDVIFKKMQRELKIWDPD